MLITGKLITKTNRNQGLYGEKIMILNQCKTFFLLALLSGLCVFLGYCIGGPHGMHIALIMALIMNVATYFFSGSIVLYLYQAQPLDKEKYSSVYTSVKELSLRMGLPMPSLWLIPDSQANAFATGRSPAHASIAITEGISHVLDERQLRGVLAHELAHIKNRDILISTIAATVATAIGYMAHMAQYAALFGPSDSRRKNDNFVVSLLIAIFMPLAAMLIQLGISRSREYLADETGAHYAQDPLSLASALETLEYQAHQSRFNNGYKPHQASTASLFIVNPFKAQGILNLLSTHPPMQERIRRLRQIHEKMF